MGGVPSNPVMFMSTLVCIYNIGFVINFLFHDVLFLFLGAKEKLLESRKKIQTSLIVPKSSLDKGSLCIKSCHSSLVANAYDSSSSSSDT